MTTDYSTESRADYLSRNIAELRAAKAECPSFGGVVTDHEIAIGQQIRAMKAELDEIEPYTAVPNGPVWAVAFKGMFLTTDDGTKFLSFTSLSDAQAWIAQNFSTERDAA